MYSSVLDPRKVIFFFFLTYSGFLVAVPYLVAFIF